VGIFDKIKQGLGRTRDALFGQVASVFAPDHELTPEDYAALEEALLRADVGPAATDRILAGVRNRLTAAAKARTTILPLDALRSEIETLLGAAPAPDPPVRPHVTLIVGVNGTGKTTTIAKLARRYKEAGNSVLLVACDTFRAAAADQLQIWAERSGVEMLRQKEGADPAAVAFDGMARALSREVERVIVDTAGRLHVKANLMAELTKIRRVIERAMPGAPHETLLVLDATTGQNGLAQALEFEKAVPLTGIVLTKLDGTAKGGVALAIAEATRTPIRWVGVGEGMEDLLPFDPKEFAAALTAPRD
jgi:fused signal recognition particle receptor